MSEPFAFPAQLIALDGGTTNTRARLVVNGQVLAEAKRPIGVRDRAISATGSPVSLAVRECLDELSATVKEARSAGVVASGMLTSEVGLFALSHVVSPAGIDELARASVTARIPDVSDREILFIPGVRIPPREGPAGWLEADMMRGEECETLGALQLLNRSGGMMIWPGSHTKIVKVDQLNRIVASHTTLTGEITITLARQTLIAKSLPETLPHALDPAAAALGREVGAREGLGRAAFLVRIADVLGTLSRDKRASFWIGAVIGDELAHLTRHPIFSDAQSIYVGGREPLRSFYGGELRRLGFDAHILDERTATIAAAVGAVAISQRSGLFT